MIESTPLLSTTSLPLDPPVRAPSDQLTHRTFLCSDIVGYTSLLARVGDLRALMMIRRHDEIVSRCTREYGMEMLELRGDSFFASFADEEAALSCAIAVQRALDRDRARNGGVHVRIGLHSGLVVEDNERHFGLNVVVAFRVTDAANADEIVCTRDVPTPGYPICREDRLDLKGVPYPVPAVWIDWNLMSSGTLAGDAA